MYLVIILSPLIGFFSVALFGRFIGPEGSTLTTTRCLFVSFVFSVVGFYEVMIMGSPVYFKIGDWIRSESILVNWGFMFDSLTLTMSVVVTFVSFLVHVYSIEYMAHDPHLPRFMSYLSLFTFFMLILITADNFVQMFLGWEGVGLCSYLLINFWFTRVQANKAAIKAMILNRVGDFCLILGITLVSVFYKSVDYATVFCLTPYVQHTKVNFFFCEINVVYLICLLFFCGAVGKSAQLGLHTWLPDAMEGPTPVSALIHAATMVTAGVFLILRCSFLFEHTKPVLHYLSLVGALTAFFASSVGLMQNDLKKIIAYSTCSQLGYMVFSCGSSNYLGSLFHLTNHAFFKALLFLSAGAVIHSVNDEQDIRKLGGLKNFIPFTYISFFVGSLALAGFPFLTGYYSKDYILEVSFSSYTTFGHFSYTLGVVGAFLTSFYSTRLICLTFLVKPNGYRTVLGYASETYCSMYKSLFLLLIPSVFAGYFFKELFSGVGSDSLSVFYVDPQNFYAFDAENLPKNIKFIPTIVSFIGFFFGFIVFFPKNKALIKLKISKTGVKCYTFLNRKWFFDKLYNEILGQFFFKTGYSISYKRIDRGLFEMIGPTGISRTLLSSAYEVHKTQSNILYHYTLIVLLVISVLFAFMSICFFTGIPLTVKGALIVFLCVFLPFFDLRQVKEFYKI